MRVEASDAYSVANSQTISTTFTIFIYPDCSQEEFSIHTVSWTQTDQSYTIAQSAITLTIDDHISNSTHYMNEYCGSITYSIDVTSSNSTEAANLASLASNVLTIT